MKEDTKFPPIGTKLRFTKRGYRWTSAEAGDEVVVVHHAKECFHTTTSRGPSDVWIFPLTWEDGLEIVEDQPPARQEGETKSNTPIMDAAMGWHDRRDLLSQIGMLEMQLSAKQAELESLKAAQGAFLLRLLDLIEGNGDRPPTLYNASEMLREHLFPTPPVERSENKG